LGFIYRVCLFMEFHPLILHEDAGPCSHPRPTRRGALAGLEKFCAPDYVFTELYRIYPLVKLSMGKMSALRFSNQIMVKPAAK